MDEWISDKSLFCVFRLKKASMGYENMFEEVPIVIKNSHLISVLLWELEDKSTAADKHELLNLSRRSDHTHTHYYTSAVFPNVNKDICKFILALRYP